MTHAAPGAGFQPDLFAYASTAASTAVPAMQDDRLVKARARLKLVGIGLAMVFSLALVRLSHLMLVIPEAPEVAAQVEAVPEGTPLLRGDVVDRNGTLLATSVPVQSVYADPGLMRDAGETALRLAAILGTRSVTDIETRLTQGGRFVWIERHITPEQAQAVIALGNPGLGLETEYRRVYPQQNLTAHVLGYTDIDGQGVAGVEQHFDDTLAAGADVTLAMDTRIQHALRDRLAESVTEFRARGAAGLVTHIKSGEVLAAISFPDFDPNATGVVDPDSRFNRVSLGVYELGSGLKIVNAALALEAGVVGMDDMLDAREPIRAGRFTIRDFHPQKRWLSVPEVFVHSSNIGSVQMALAAGTERQKAFFDTLELTRPMRMEVPEVGHPLLPDRWRWINTMTIAFGHGIAVTPLHLARTVGGIVNDGVMLPLTFVKRTTGDVVPGKQVVSQDTSRNIRTMMRLASLEGTGRNADVPGFHVGGKTGTAEKAGVGGYRRKALISSFVGVFPVHDPEYLVFVMLDEPVGHKGTFNYATGGWTAAPAAGRVIGDMVAILGLHSTPDNVPEIRQLLTVQETATVRRFIQMDKDHAGKVQMVQHTFD